MTGFKVVQTYLGAYPRLTLLALTFTVVSSVIGGWQRGAEILSYGILAYVLMMLELKLMLLLMLHERLFAFPRQIAPVLLAIGLLAVAALAAAYPILEASCAGC